MKTLIKLALVGFIAYYSLALIPNAAAHSGGTDKYGCHKNHKTGVYHCH